MKRGRENTPPESEFARYIKKINTEIPKISSQIARNETIDNITKDLKPFTSHSNPDIQIAATNLLTKLNNKNSYFINKGQSSIRRLSMEQINELDKDIDDALLELENKTKDHPELKVLLGGKKIKQISKKHKSRLRRKTMKKTRRHRRRLTRRRN